VISVRIGIFTDCFSDEETFGGGVGSSVYRLSRELAKRGNSVVVFTHSSSYRSKTKICGSLTIIRYGKTLRIGNTDLSLKILYEPLGYGLDVVNAHSGTLALMAAFVYSLVKRRPLVFSHRGDYVIGYGDPVRRALVALWSGLIVKVILIHATVIVVLSKQMTKISGILRNHERKTVVIPSGIDSEEIFFVPRESARQVLGWSLDEKVILFVGSLTEVKGVHVLVRACPKIVSGIGNCRIVVVGPPYSKSYLNKLMKMAHELLVEDRIVFAGPRYGHELALYYNAADVFVLPSFSEGMPRVLLEAASYGLPIVASNLPQLRAVVKSGFNGYLANAGDASDLACKIVSLLESKDTRERMRSNSRSVSKNFSWSKVCGRYECLFGRVLLEYGEPDRTSGPSGTSRER
jgi:glycosyltransferase involved in cell wall biosynthesis